MTWFDELIEAENNRKAITPIRKERGILDMQPKRKKFVCPYCATSTLRKTESEEGGLTELQCLNCGRHLVLHTEETGGYGP